jgi:hypothetical protein
MPDPVWVDNVTPLNAGNMTKLQTRDEKGAVNGYASLDAGGKVPAAQLSAAILASLVDVKGDLIAATGPDAVARLPVGSDSAFLTADSAVAAGLSYNYVHDGNAGISIAGANTDLGWLWGKSQHVVVDVFPAGGSLRTIAAPGYGDTTTITLRNGTTGTLTIQHNGAGAGAALSLRDKVDLVLGDADSITFVRFLYGGTPYWVEIGRSVAPRYAAYTPVWTAAGTAPFLGNANVAACRWARIGKFVHYMGAIFFGNTSTFGSGQYSISLPVSSNNIAGQRLGPATWWDSSAGQAGLGTWYLATGNTMSGVWGAAWPMGALSLLQDTAPFVWAANDEMHWNVMYEAV